MLCDKLPEILSMGHNSAMSPKKATVSHIAGNKRMVFDIPTLGFLPLTIYADLMRQKRLVVGTATHRLTDNSSGIEARFEGSRSNLKVRQPISWTVLCLSEASCLRTMSF